jgi:phosphoribosylformylglycinamidine synthase
VALFAESVARAVVAVPADRVAELEDLAATHGVPVTPLGTTGSAGLAVAGLFDVPLDELRAAHEGTLPALFG